MFLWGLITVTPNLDLKFLVLFNLQGNFVFLPFRMLAFLLTSTDGCSNQTGSGETSALSLAFSLPLFLGPEVKRLSNCFSRVLSPPYRPRHYYFNIKPLGPK